MKKTGLALVVGTLLGALSMTEAAQSAVAQAFGAFPSHQTEEIYDLSVGATAAGNNAAYVLARCQCIRLSAWVRPRAFCKLKWQMRCRV